MESKRKYMWIAFLAFIIGLVAGFLQGYHGANIVLGEGSGSVTVRTETIVDTILYQAPLPQSELALGTHRYTLPIYTAKEERHEAKPQHNKEGQNVDTLLSMHNYGTGAGGEPRCSKDNAVVELPVIQRHYADSTYEAWVSGPIDPRLDSLRVFAPTTIITKQEWKPPKRWHMGVTAGYGYGAKGFQPYIGVGITYSIFSF